MILFIVSINATVVAINLLREVCGDNPFQAYPKILKICDAVENIEKVKETVGNKFSDCPI